MKLKIYLPFFLICFTFFSCAGSSEPDGSVQLAFYLLQDESLNWDELKNINNKDSIPIKEWITPQMIESYDFSSHSVYLNNTEIGNSIYFKRQVFVAVIGGKRCYYGSIGSSLKGDKNIYQWESYSPGRDVLILSYYQGAFHKDLRNDENIKRVLMETGKYRSGIKVTIDDLHSEIDKGQMYFVFTFTFKNVDNQTLYVGDPEDIMDNTGYYTAATHLDFQPISTDSSYYGYFPCYNSGKPYRRITPDNISVNNMLCLKSGAYVQRTYRIRRLSKMPDGGYRCLMRFFGMVGISAAKRSLPGGRVYMNWTYSNIMDVTLEGERLIIKNSDFQPE